MDHYPAVTELWKSDPGIGLSPSDGPESLQRFLDRNPGLSFLSLSDKRSVTGTVLAGHDGRRGFLYHLFVVPERRRGGLGRRLAGASLEALQKLGIEKVHVMVYAANASGHAFWKKCGFAERNEITLMSRTLSGSGSGGCGC